MAGDQKSSDTNDEFGYRIKYWFNKQESVVKAAIITGVFALFAALIGGVCGLMKELGSNKPIIVSLPSSVPNIVVTFILPTGTEAASKRTMEAESALLKTQSSANAEHMTYLLQNTRHFKGRPDAPITIIEFSDFQDAFSRGFAIFSGAQINETYVNTGIVRFGYWNFAFLGEESVWAAEAAECAADQGKYWEYHDTLFTKQNGINLGTFSKENLKQFAVELNLDIPLFNECLDSGKYTELIQSDTDAAQQMTIPSVPSFLVNGVPIVGTASFDQFQHLIDQLLNN